MPKSIPDKGLQLIKENASMPIENIQSILLEHDIIVDNKQINRALAQLRGTAAMRKAAVAEQVDLVVQDYINVNTNKYLNMLDGNISRINDILSDKDKIYKCLDSDGNPNPEKFIKFSRLMGEQIRILLSIRPVESTHVNKNLNINIHAKGFEDTIEKYFAEYKNSAAVNEKARDKDISSSSDVTFVE